MESVSFVQVVTKQEEVVNRWSLYAASQREYDILLSSRISGLHRQPRKSATILLRQNSSMISAERRPQR
jgi:hypothetical protein